MNFYLNAFIEILLICLLIFSLDDFFIDVVAFLFRLKPKKIDATILTQESLRYEKKIAIMIANWHEAEVIQRMIRGNIQRILYKKYHFFLGVYPNDPSTYQEVIELEKMHANVTAVVNEIPGPTTKGQMLNQVARFILDWENKHDEKFDLFLMHDSEDILHPHSLSLLNVESRQHDFFQIPVFSYDIPNKEWIGASYIDEFSECHTKDLLVRSFLKAGLPSAGTGTAMTRDLFLNVIRYNGGKLLNEKVLTEDYFLGLLVDQLGYRSQFLCYYIASESSPKSLIKNKKKKDWIATREYFPKKWRQSIRQKTRWITGIHFQGKEILPWKGSMAHRYFLWRDRRGFLNFIVLTFSYIFTVIFFISLSYNYWTKKSLFDFTHSSSQMILCLLIVNSIFFTFRAFRRCWAVYQVHHFRLAIGVLLRWIPGNIINIVSQYSAWRSFLAAQRNNAPIRWQKTQHELPKDFGLEMQS